MYEEIKKIKFAKSRFKKALKIAWIGSLLILVFQFIFSIRAAHFISEDKFYPRQAILYLREHVPEGEIFSKYGWGGYLIWRFPEKKVFIDGRMPSWRWNKNLPEESPAAFDEYNGLLEGKLDHKTVFDKYSVNTVLWPQNRETNNLGLWSEKFENYLVRLGVKKPEFNFIKSLEGEGWGKVYEDDISAIYQRK